MCAGHAPLPPKSPSRRGFLFKLGLALNVLGRRSWWGSR